MLGTIVNSITVIVGCLVGLIVKGRLTEKISTTIMNGLALCTLYIGISGALNGGDTLIMIISVAIGALIGEIIDIDKAWVEYSSYHRMDKLVEEDEPDETDKKREVLILQ